MCTLRRCVTQHGSIARVRFNSQSTVPSLAGSDHCRQLMTSLKWPRSLIFICRSPLTSSLDPPQSSFIQFSRVPEQQFMRRGLGLFSEEWEVGSPGVVQCSKIYSFFLINLLLPPSQTLPSHAKTLHRIALDLRSPW